jgi:hypothetical protein
VSFEVVIAGETLVAFAALEGFLLGVRVSGENLVFDLNLFLKNL